MLSSPEDRQRRIREGQTLIEKSKRVDQTASTVMRWGCAWFAALFLAAVIGSALDCSDDISEPEMMAKAFLLRKDVVAYGCDWEFPHVRQVGDGWWQVTAEVTDRYENTMTYTVYTKETGDDVWSLSYSPPY